MPEWIAWSPRGTAGCQGSGSWWTERIGWFAPAGAWCSPPAGSPSTRTWCAPTAPTCCGSTCRSAPNTTTAGRSGWARGWALPPSAWTTSRSASPSRRRGHSCAGSSSTARVAASSTRTPMPGGWARRRSPNTTASPTSSTPTRRSRSTSPATRPSGWRRTPRSSRPTSACRPVRSPQRSSATTPRQPRVRTRSSTRHRSTWFPSNRPTGWST